MMFQSKMVCCLKANGKVLREFKDTVYVPFGSEYSILIKNLNSTRAKVNITIDGTEAVPGGLVVNANQEIDLERFVKDMNQGNRFKFIERTAGVEAGRGVKLEDGIIRVSFKYEKVVPTQPNWVSNIHGDKFPWYPPGMRSFQQNMNVGGTLRSVDYSKGEYSKGIASAAVEQYCSMNNIGAMDECHAGSATMDCYASPADIGITVPGSLSEQKFQTVSDFLTEAEEHVMVLRILGETATAKVTAPVTVKAKPKCVTCGKVNKATSNFCASCGTSLQIVA
jgi:hypothetical protein